MAASKKPPEEVLPSRPSGRVRTGIVVFAFAYLATIWLDAVGSNLPLRFAPRVWIYFSQIAALFVNAGVMSIDYRAEAWNCEGRKWAELDVSPWFRIDSDNKENRFHRGMQFYRKERKVLRALDEFLVSHNNELPARPKIGGVRFLSLRIPYPALGSHVEANDRKPLATYPESMRHVWYYTPGSKRRDRCGDSTPIRDEENAPASKTDRRTDDAKDVEPNGAGSKANERRGAPDDGKEGEP